MSSAENLQASVNLLRFAASHEFHRQEMERATGESFNLFRVLGIGHLEVRTHSPILGELLDPNGSHGQGDTFLKLFFEELGITDLAPQRCRLRLEHYVGPINEKSGGRIDLVIQDVDQPSKAILIENKIFAGDQDDQLLRYRNAYPNGYLFYLTLDGSAPGNVTETGAQELDFRCISYGEEILKWLVKCKKEATSLPGLREMIGQYHHLISELTGKSISKAMNAKLIEEILRVPENLDAFYALRDATWQVEQQVFKQLDEDLDSMAARMGLVRDKHLENLERKDSEFSFMLPQLNKRNLKMSFCFEIRGYRNFCFGFSTIQSGEAVVDIEEVQRLFAERFAPETPNPWWPAWTYFDDPYRNWDAEAFKGARFGDFVVKIEEKLNAMMEIANRLPEN
jgi:hypothetical protein